MLSKQVLMLRHRAQFARGIFTKKYGSGVSAIVVQVHHPRQVCPTFGTVRFSSSSTVVPPVITKAIEAATPSLESVTHSSSLDAVIESIGAIPEAPLPPAPKVLEILANGEPSLQALGLAGYSPVGLIHRILEFVHVTADVSWASSIIIVAAIMRALLFHVLVRQRQESAKVSAVMPQMQFLQQKLTAAREQNDLIGASRYAMELSEFQKKGGSMFGMLKYAFVQGFVLISFTQALRSMSNLPVESMKTGGYLSFLDLTVADPSHVLPLVNGVLLYTHMATGKEISKMFPTRPYLVQGCMIGLSSVVCVVGWNFPSAIILYWISSLGVTAIQHRILTTPSVKKYYNLDIPTNTRIAEMMAADKKKSKSNLGFWAQFKEAQANNRIAAEVRRRADLDAAEFERAGREPIRKTYKYDVTKVKK